MRKHIPLIVLALLMIAWGMSGCTDNTRARSFGGTENADLPKGQKLVTVTWKETNLWVLTRQMRADEQPETYTFQEKSSWGLIQGTVHFKEAR